MSDILYRVVSCILSKFYIKPQRKKEQAAREKGCILSKFYIKPQQWMIAGVLRYCCILSKFYIKPQQYTDSWKVKWSCILSKFYIKPQREWLRACVCAVVSYRNSTSNHNLIVVRGLKLALYLIEILHQTTTMRNRLYCKTKLYLIEILHQTTTNAAATTSDS